MVEAAIKVADAELAEARSRDRLTAVYKVESEKMKAFCETATAEEGWCHWCGDYSADEEAPALTRLRAEVVRLRALVESAEQKAADYLSEIEAAHEARDHLAKAMVEIARLIANGSDAEPARQIRAILDRTSDARQEAE
jgi:hypothetical protein